MQNVTMKIDAATVQRIVEKHINESLAPEVAARVSMVSGSMAPVPSPNQPTHELHVTFEVVANPRRRS